MILHPQLKQDCMVIGRFPLSMLLLMNDRHYPWFILVPQRENMREIHQMKVADQQQLMRESAQLAAYIETAFQADKINIAALGNIVPQLHIHHIVRHTTDPAWPAPIWGKLKALPYAEADAKSIISMLRRDLPLDIDS